MLDILLITIAILSFGAWNYLYFFRGNFWKSDQEFRGPGDAPAAWPTVAIVVPARDEAETIGPALMSLSRQIYPGKFRIILVDDQSSDGTAEIARSAIDQADRLEIVEGEPLPDGWAGKMWAVAQGLKAAAAALPDTTYVLLTDADIYHPPSNLRQMVGEAETDRLGLLSQMAVLRCRTNWEQVLIPAFVFFFQKLYPFAWINDPRRKTAGAAGGCMLVRCTAIDAAGGIRAIHDQIIDDCALAATIKPQAPIKLYLATKTRSLRTYARLTDIWHMVRRTAFVQLRQSVLALLGTAIAMLIVYGGPPLTAIWGMFTGNSQIWVPGLAAWIMMTVAYMPTVIRYGLPGWRAYFLPVAAFLYVLMTVDSARLYLFGRAPVWKGRHYSPRARVQRT